MPKIEETPFRLEHVTGEQLLKRLHQAIKGNVFYTVTIEPEQEKTAQKAMNIIPDFYDDDEDSEQEIASIVNARTTTQRTTF